MKYLLYSGIIWLLAFNMMALNSACNNSTKSNNSDQKLNASSNNSDSELKVGGLYLIKNESGDYSVSKIIAIDSFAVHVRIYADKFQTEPRQITSANLKVMIGHAPIDAKGFLAENPELVKIEDLKDSELEGYNIYLEEMRK
jgi:hypothetical protein